MKKFFTLIAIFICVWSICIAVDYAFDAPSTNDVAVEPVVYFSTGRYYFNADLQGQVLTDDGNVWEYTQDIISDKPAYHNEPVIVCLADNGTPDDIYDDEIVGLVLDRETAIYDALEASLSDAFELERDDNNIRIQSIKMLE